MSEKFNPSPERQNQMTEFRLSEEEVWGNPELEREYVEERRPAIAAGERIWLQSHIPKLSQNDDYSYGAFKIMNFYDKSNWHGDYVIDLSITNDRQVTNVTQFIVKDGKPIYKRLNNNTLTEQEARDLLEQAADNVTN